MKLVKQHLIGIVLFSIIVGAAIFVSEYFAVLPIPAEGDELSIISCEIFETPNLQINGMVFDEKTKEFRATFACKNTLPNKAVKDGDWGIKSASPKCVMEDKVLHFFAVKKGKAQYLFTQDVVMGLVDTGGNALTKPFESEPLLKLKASRNIYVNAEYKSDYKSDSIPIFNPELAVRVLMLDDLPLKGCHKGGN